MNKIVNFVSRCKGTAFSDSVQYLKDVIFSKQKAYYEY